MYYIELNFNTETLTNNHSSMEDYYDNIDDDEFMKAYIDDILSDDFDYYWHYNCDD